jgi:hypothetical protein
MLRCTDYRLHISQSGMELWRVGARMSYPHIGGF